MDSRFPPRRSDANNGPGSSTLGDGLRSLAFDLNRLGSVASRLLLQHECQISAPRIHTNPQLLHQDSTLHEVSLHDTQSCASDQLSLGTQCNKLGNASAKHISKMAYCAPDDSIDPPWLAAQRARLAPAIEARNSQHANTSALKQSIMASVTEDDMAQVRRPFIEMMKKPCRSKESLVSTGCDLARGELFDDELPCIDDFASLSGESDKVGSYLLGEIALRPEWKIRKNFRKDRDGLLRFEITVLDAPDEKYLSTICQRTNVRGSGLLAGNIRFTMLQAPITTMFSTRKHTFLLHPVGTPRITWCFLTFLLISYDVIFIPMQFFPLPKSNVLSVVEWICTAIWSLDVIINFRSGYFVGNRVEMNARRIAANYAKSWLFLDLGVVTFEWLGRFGEDDSTSSDPGSILKLPRFLRGVRVIRLLRLMKLPRIMQLAQDQFNSPVIHPCLWLIKLTVGLLVVIHYLTCGWYFIGDTGYESERGWTDYAMTAPCGDVNMSPEGDLARSEELATKTVAFWYVQSARWVLSQVNGRTDQDARRNLIEMCYTCVLAVCGPLLCMALFTSSITATMMELSETAAGRKKQMLLLNQYLNAHKVSPALNELMKMHVRNRRSEDMGDHEKEVLLLLPTALQSELLFQVRQPHFVEHHFFSFLEQCYPRALRHVCTQNLQTLLVQATDRVFEKGDSCTRMFFAIKGTFLYAKREGNKKNLMKQMTKEEVRSHTDLFDGMNSSSLSEKPSVSDYGGSDMEEEYDSKKGKISNFKAVWICEAALWLEWHHLGGLAGCTQGALIVLELTGFIESLKIYSNALPLTRNYASEFVVKLKQYGKLSDIIDLKVVCSGHSNHRKKDKDDRK